MSLRRAWPFVMVLLSIVGCGGSPASPDAGSDAGPPPADGGPPFACERARPIEGVLDGMVTVMVDTTMTDTRPRDLGLSCGNVEGEVRWARQEVIEFHVPGEGSVAVEIDTTGEGTPLHMNSVIQVRRDCLLAPQVAAGPFGAFPPTCFDDPSEGELRGRGHVPAVGGETLYIYVTGYSDPPPESGAIDEGPIQVDLYVRGNSAPQLTAGFVRLAGNDVMIGATGSDVDRDIRGIAMNFVGPDGELLDIWGDGVAELEGDVIVVPFDPPPATETYDQYFVIRDDQLTLGRYLRAAQASAVILRLYDRGNAPSGELEVPITEAAVVGYQENCDATTGCRSPMACIDGLCQAVGGYAAVCDAATTLAIATPTDTATSVRQTGTTGAGYGWYAASCTNEMGWIGAEKVYSVDVPEGAFDLLATTNLPGSGSTDTILYVRRACPDPGTELACNDDLGADPHSAVEIRDAEAGRYSIFVERYGGAGSGAPPHEIEVTLRPVLATGATCDPAGVANRCAAGACAAGVCP